LKASLPQSRSRWKSSSEAADGPAVFSLGYPALFHWAVLGVALGLLLYAAVRHILPVLALCVFVLVSGAVSWLWSRQSLRRVSCALTLNHGRAFPGESVEITLEVANGKWLPLSCLEIECELPFKLTHGIIKQPSPYTRERPRWVTSIPGGRRITWKHRLECKARGDYRLGPVRLRCGDIPGLFPRETILPPLEPLLVYPRIIPLTKLSLPLKQLFGEVSAPRNIYEDVSRPVGTRDYRHDDPFKRIQWKASARVGKLQARHYESTSGLSLLLILDVYSFCQEDEVSEEAFELALSTAASLAYRAHVEKAPAGLVANSTPEIQISISSGQDQLMRVLETLARMQPEAKRPIHVQLDQTPGILPLGVTPIIIAHRVSPGLAGLFQKFCLNGFSPLLLSCAGQTRAQDFDGVPSVSIYSAGDIARCCQEHVG